MASFCVSLEQAKRDAALSGRGERKLLVTEIYPGREIEATQPAWSPAQPCPVQRMKDTESAVFTQLAKQTRHRHRTGTEIYLPIEGEMTIEVEGTDYRLRPGDMLVVNPGAFHEVRRDGEFLCRVITVNCGGLGDRQEDRGEAERE